MSLRTRRQGPAEDGETRGGLEVAGGRESGELGEESLGLFAEFLWRKASSAAEARAEGRAGPGAGHCCFAFFLAPGSIGADALGSR